MKVTASLLSALAATVFVGGHASEDTKTLRKTFDRDLQNYNYNGYQNGQQAYGYNQYGGGQAQDYDYNGQNAQYNGYENMEEYMRAQMAQRTFSFTGCSSVQGNYGMQTFVTYRLCENCNNRKGCSNYDGDYIVNMQEFSETYREYYEEMTGRDGSPFECMRVEEFQENYYQYNAYQNNGDQQYYQYQGQQQYYQNGQQENAQQQYYQNQQQQQELFIGPSCTGGSDLQLGVFYNEWCTYPAEGVSVQDVLGFEPKNSFDMNTCISCSSSYNYNNNGQQEAEINPLCERMLERSGRCDRNGSKKTEFDSFWEDVVEFVNGGGTFQEENYYQDADEADYGYQQDQNQYNYWNGNRQLQYYGMDYYQYQNENTCEFIDSLPHSNSGGSWTQMKEGAANKGVSVGGLICIIFGSIVVAAVFAFMAFGWFARKGVEVVGHVASFGESETPYQRDGDAGVKQGAVVA